MTRFVAALSLGVLILNGCLCSSKPIERVPQRMIGEEITLTVGGDHRVSVDVIMRFVGPFRAGDRLVFPETDWFPLERVTVQWNGIGIPVAREAPPARGIFSINGDYYPALFVFTIPAHHDGTRRENALRVQYRYLAPRFAPGNRAGHPAGRYIEYILRTGATWRDTIGSIELTVLTPPGKCGRLMALDDSYAGACVSPDRYEYRNNNLKPLRNIRMVIGD